MPASGNAGTDVWLERVPRNKKNYLIIHPHYMLPPAQINYCSKTLSLSRAYGTKAVNHLSE
jgi:hypothetical protein